MIKKINFKALIISIAIPLLIGFLAGKISADSMSQYQNLIQPALAPPGFLFPLVWTILYVLMGISFYLIWRAMGFDKSRAYLLYALQLFFNFGWTFIFFNQNMYLAAFIWLIALWFIVFAMIKSFAQIDKRAAYLQIPYLLWLTFAAYLNLAIYLLN